MDYFDLTSTILPRLPGAGTNSTLPTPPPTGHRDTQQQSFGNRLQDGQDNDPTPVGTPLDRPGSISISTVFHPGLEIQGAVPDVVLVSIDGVHFYAHQKRLLAASANRLTGLVPSPPNHSLMPAPPLTVHVPHKADVANVIFHVMYGLSVLQFLPTLETVEAALDALIVYAIPLQAYASEGSPLFQLVHSFSPFRPLDVYALAAHHELEELAVAASSHLLAYDLARLPDEAIHKMGPLYLKRLFLLHQSRLAALRNILFKSPVSHPPTPICSEDMQEQLTRSWALVIAQLVWDILPSISTDALQSLLQPVGALITCPLCMETLQRRLQEVVFEWSSVKRTI